MTRTGPDFDALVAAAKAGAPPQDLWRAWYSLDAHWLLGSPSTPGSPFVGEVDGAGWVFLFTDSVRAFDTAPQLLGVTPEEVRAIKVHMPGAIDWLVSLGASGVTGIRVNQGASGFFAPLTNLVPMREYYAAEAARQG